MGKQDDVNAGGLAGLRVVELGGIGPGPHAAMILADHGADVVRVDRANRRVGLVDPGDHLHRTRRLIHLDFRNECDRDQLVDLVSHADVLIEGFRPGTAERWGLGPDRCMGRNPRLIYARMTGWGQDGPLAREPGHDINYLAVTGALHAIGRSGERPVPPMNLVGDFGGGSMLLVVGILTALYERERSNCGQIIDAAMVDGVSLLMQMVWSMFAAGQWRDERGTNLADGGAPFYDTYRCADGNFVAVGAIEPRFFAGLLDGLALDADLLPAQADRDGWPVLRAAFDLAFSSRGRDAWVEVFAGTDACVSPVLSLSEAAAFPHLKVRSTLVEVDGATQVNPAPRLSRSGSVVPRQPTVVDCGEILIQWRAESDTPA